MPIVLTIATVMSLSRESDAGAPRRFTDAESLIEKIEPAMEAGPRRDAALAAVDRLAKTIEAYHAQAKTGLRLYLQESTVYDTGPDDLEAGIFEAIESRRRAALLEIVAVRERLKELLTAAEWKAAFGN